MVGPIFGTARFLACTMILFEITKPARSFTDDKIARDADLRHALKTASRTRPEARNMPVRFLSFFFPSSAKL